jgi:DNA mismatch endonuclease (patch repair protein)
MKCRDGRTPTSNQQYWVPKFRRIAKRDRNAVKNLRKLGWRVVICWECEIRERPKAIMSTIYSRIRFSQSGS